MTPVAEPTVALVKASAKALTGSKQDYDLLLKMIGEARFVLLGEASHGTHEFYRERAEITKRLIQEKGFNVVAAEADWPDAYRVNRYVRGVGDDSNADEALGGFTRFPQWMWRNRDALNFVGWLREYNDGLGQYARKVGFYGLDLYSLFGSIEAVLGYLNKVDPEAAQRARLVVEPARPAHGRDAARIGGAPRSAGAADEGRRVGAQLAPRRRAGDRNG